MIALSVLAVVLWIAALQAFPVVFWGGEFPLNPGGFAVVNRVYEHPFWLAATAVVVLLAAVVLGVRNVFVRTAAAGAAALVLACGVWLSIPLSADAEPSADRRTVEYRSPDERFTLTVSAAAKFQGPTWLLRIRSHDGLNSREHVLGCLDGDNPDEGLAHVSWADPTTVRVERGDGTTIDVRLDPDTGAPDRRLGSGVGPCYGL
ncbi:hypothetical protein SAMN05443668_1011277 [Cryptosporangium aurantiacum]|uniref:Uncharacterized protein n=1 Tax=Cryptosporangium aurantiacum TaxID=134849 RepID=A0A1M7KW01_9ACTN|nr:hypothetical protein SAMN05443668_1011277 [Cryptosporangium aurantiacum]